MRAARMAAVRVTRKGRRKDAVIRLRNFRLFFPFPAFRAERSASRRPALFPNAGAAHFFPGVSMSTPIDTDQRTAPATNEPGAQKKPARPRRPRAAQKKTAISSAAGEEAARPASSPRQRSSRRAPMPEAPAAAEEALLCQELPLQEAQLSLPAEIILTACLPATMAPEILPAPETPRGETRAAAPAAPARRPPRPADAAVTETPPQKRPKRKMYISIQTGEQTEVVLTEDGQVEEYYVEMLHQAKTRGNIYKGVIHNIDANLQAAFVSYGAEKNGFLQIDEVHPEYWLAPHDGGQGKKYPLIQKVLQVGQEVLVQVVKEPTGTKGAFLSTYLSLAGRFLVLTPGSEQIGVSRKVENPEERERLRSMLEGLDPGPGLGVIVRTASLGADREALLRDFQYLMRLWEDIRAEGTKAAAPCLLYREPDLAERAVRDYLTEDVNEVWVDDEATAIAIREVISRLFPRRPGLVKTHRDQMQSLWDRFSLMRQLEQIYAREVTLPSGGRLVFDQTEALTAIDINSGKISGKTNFESMALKTNQEAAEAIARQLRLRDLGGQVVIDFIEMRDRSHWREVEKTLRNAMRSDRARYDVGRISSFGLLELVRQRLGSSALSITMEMCPVCRGTGLRRNMEWQAQQALRDIRRRLRGNKGGVLVCEYGPELTLYLLNSKRSRLAEMEREFDQTIEIRPHH